MSIRSPSARPGRAESVPEGGRASRSAGAREGRLDLRRFGTGPTIVLACGLALLAAGCGERPGESARSAEQGAADPSSASGADTTAQVPAAGPDSAALARLALPGDESPPEPVTYRLLLVNPNPGRAVVHASAGAGRVVLDTVPGADSLRIDVRLRARAVRLEAADVGGRSLGTMELLLEPDSVHRWEVPFGKSRPGTAPEADATPRSFRADARSPRGGHGSPGLALSRRATATRGR